MYSGEMRVAGLSFVLPLIPTLAFGGDPKPASSGSTDVAKEGFVNAQGPEKEEEAQKNFAFGKLTFGGLAAAGNARSVALTAALEVHGRDGANMYGLDFAGN